MNETPNPRNIPEKSGVQTIGTSIQKTHARPQSQTRRMRYGTKTQLARKPTNRSRNQREASIMFP